MIAFDPMRGVWFGVLVMSAVGCGSGASTPEDASVERVDTSVPRADGALPTDRDAGGDDAGALDAATSDASTRDAATTDASTDAQVPLPALGCGLPELGTTGAVHYFCDCGPGADTSCVPGDDAADGLSPSSARRSYEAARRTFSTMAAGDVVALCRGGSFAAGADSHWVNAACRADAPCTLRSYTAPASAVDARPILTARAGQHGLSLEDGGNADHEEGYVFAELQLIGSGSGFGVFFYNDIDDVDVCDVDISRFDVAFHVAGSNPPATPASDARNDRISLRASHIHDNAGQGYLGGCSDGLIEGTRFTNNGFGRAVFNHNIYLSSPSGGAVGMRVVGNTLHRSTLVAGRCAGVSLVVHGHYDDLVIEDNHIHEDLGAAGDGCWGIAIDGGYSSAEVFRRVVVRRNTIENVGNVSIGLGSCIDCVVENNVVIQWQGLGGAGVVAPDRPTASGDAVMTNLLVRNNSVSFGTSGTGVVVTEGVGHSIVSNAIELHGPSSTCFDLASPLTGTTSDYNACYRASGGSWASGARSLTSLRSAGLETASVESTSPFFVDPRRELRATGTVLRDSGDPTRSARDDHTGAARDTRPDVGAYEAR